MNKEIRLSKKLRSHFFTNSKEQQETLKNVLQKGFDFYSGTTRDNLVLQFKTFGELSKILEQPVPKKSQSILQINKKLDLILKYSIAQFDQNYLAFPDCGNSMAGLIGSIINKFTNQNLITFDRGAPVATVIEIQVINWLRQIIGYRTGKLSEIKSLAEVGGMITSGGHMSNHVAVLMALNSKFPEVKQSGVRGLKTRPVILMSKQVAHYSFAAATHHLGLGLDSIIEIPATHQLTTDPQKINELIKTLPDDVVPFMLVITAGNSRTCSIDNIEALSKISQKHNLWFHVDACHGGALLFSKKLRKRLSGIEYADSVSIDPHKGMFLPYPNSYVLFNDPMSLLTYSRYSKQLEDGASMDLGMITPFYGSRGFESLSMWLLLQELGLSGLDAVMEYREKLANVMEKLIGDVSYFLPLHEMDYYRLAFVFLPKQIQNLIKRCSQDLSVASRKGLLQIIEKYTHYLNEELYKSGLVCLDEYKMHDKDNRMGLDIKEKVLVMGITIGNPLYTEKSFIKAISHTQTIAENLIPDYLRDVFRFLATTDNKHLEKKINRLFGPAGW
jgi:glutamate/tyrosine decarboxylase-like PLP-dependent enzyme